MGRLRERAAAVDRRYREHWDALATGEPDGAPVWAVLGDSVGVGLGAPRVADSYVAVAARRLAARLTSEVHVVNLAVSGATAETVVREQLPLLAALPRVDVVSCVVGGNDVAWPLRFRVDRFAVAVEAIAGGIPNPAVLGTVPSFGHPPYEGRVRRANTAVRAAAARHGHRVADIHAIAARTGCPTRLRQTSEDFFHPNAEGHRRWATALEPELLAALRQR